MSAAPKIIEGSWEEIVARSHELAGHRLRVIVLDEVRPTSTQDTLSPEVWAARLEDWAFNRPPITHFVDDSRESIYKDRLDAQLGPEHGQNPPT